MRNVSATPVLLNITGEHNLGYFSTKKWTKAMVQDAFFEMLERFEQQYKCEVDVIKLSKGVVIATVRHEVGTIDKIVAKPIT